MLFPGQLFQSSLNPVCTTADCVTAGERTGGCLSVRGSFSLLRATASVPCKTLFLSTCDFLWFLCDS